MGFDTSATKSIFFIASVIVAVVLSGVFTGVTYKLSSDIDMRGTMLSDVLKSDIEIINDPENVPYNSTTNELIIYVKNTGKSILSTSDLTIIIDGFVVPEGNFSIEILGEYTAWSPGIVIKITIIESLSSGDHKIKVVLDNGVYDEMYFRI
ncbi:MAG: flagellar protein G [Thermoplasmata archaeon]|nr:flagellar protein G [Euryarchaeota archaeon]RLF63939.1 MAG: flagellar protein G [Thermoplasmata archaeon]